MSYVECLWPLHQKVCTHTFCKEVRKGENDSMSEEKHDPAEAINKVFKSVEETLREFREAGEIARVAMDVRRTGKPQTIHGVLIICKDAP